MSLLKFRPLTNAARILPIRSGIARRSAAIVVSATAVVALAAAPFSDQPAQARATKTLAVAPSYTFDDEFTGSLGTLPTAQWTLQTGGSGWGNNEVQQYTNRAANAQLDGAGNLAITARKETYTGSDGITRSYTSARLNSKVPVAPGYVEARINVPAGQGLWPAFWMVGSNIYQVGWPTCGEIDVLESVNAMTTAYANIHGATTLRTAYQFGSSVTPPGGLASTWHTYAVSWTTQSMSFYLDGVRYYSGNRSALPATDIWAFDQSQYILLNLAVGGNGPGAPNASTPTSATMLIDWVHAGAGIPSDAS